MHTATVGCHEQGFELEKEGMDTVRHLSQKMASADKAIDSSCVMMCSETGGHCVSNVQVAEEVEVAGVLSRAAPCRLTIVLRRDSGSLTEVVDMAPSHLIFDVKLPLVEPSRMHQGR